MSNDRKMDKLRIKLRKQTQEYLKLQAKLMVEFLRKEMDKKQKENEERR